MSEMKAVGGDLKLRRPSPCSWADSCHHRGDW